MIPRDRYRSPLCQWLNNATRGRSPARVAVVCVRLLILMNRLSVSHTTEYFCSGDAPSDWSKASTL